MTHSNNEVRRCEGGGDSQGTVVMGVNQGLIQIQHHDLTTNRIYQEQWTLLNYVSRLTKDA